MAGGEAGIPYLASDLANPARRLAFFAGLALLFLRLSMLHQILGYVTRVNFYPLYVFGLPALAGVLLSGGLRRTYEGRPAYYWTGFAICMVIAVPFSTWRGGSFGLTLSYLEKDFIMLFVVAGLALTWAECKLMMSCAVLGGLVNVLSAPLFQGGDDGRLGLEFGSIANANDYAAHLLFILPFLLWAVLNRGSAKILRVAALFAIAGGAYMVLRTASRGGEIALGVELLAVFLWATATTRLVIGVLAPFLLAASLALMPPATLQRLRSFSTDDPLASQEALESSNARRYLLGKSIEYTFTHPIVGVGPGQFSAYEGGHNTVLGSHGLWHETHNSYTQVSSECGIPALLFFVAGIGSTFLLLRRTYRQARARPDCRDIAVATFCLMVALAGFCTAITFLTFGYFVYLPAMLGLSIAVTRAARIEFQTRQLQTVPAAPAFAR
ncbi:MAG: O-antigen ligase family protein [Acidobacteriia bacterium]|nr:O-antigen ligase family protein [Terriglobia bacterium]